MEIVSSAIVGIVAGVTVAFIVTLVQVQVCATRERRRAARYRRTLEVAAFLERLRGDTPRIVCPRCGMVSYHPDDIAAGYCGKCHDWTGQPTCPTR